MYDFGQLNTGAEKDYMAQIVNEHVSCRLSKFKFLHGLCMLCFAMLLFLGIKFYFR